MTTHDSGGSVHALPPRASGDPWRPTVDDVAGLLRARTKDSEGQEVGTFTDDTRPTATQVEDRITASYALVTPRFGPVADFPQVYDATVAQLVAYRAALQIEKSFFPEQVSSDRSAYDQLREEYLHDLDSLLGQLAGAGAGEGVPGHRAGSEWTPTFLKAYGTGAPYFDPPLGPGLDDYWPEAENPENWAQPLQPPREPPLPEDLPVGDRPTSGLDLGSEPL